MFLFPWQQTAFQMAVATGVYINLWIIVGVSSWLYYGPASAGFSIFSKLWCAGLDSNQRRAMPDRFTACCN